MRKVSKTATERQNLGGGSTIAIVTKQTGLLPWQENRTKLPSLSRRKRFSFDSIKNLLIVRLGYAVMAW